MCNQSVKLLRRKWLIHLFIQRIQPSNLSQIPIILYPRQLHSFQQMLHQTIIQPIQKTASSRMIHNSVLWYPWSDVFKFFLLIVQISPQIHGIVHLLQPYLLVIFTFYPQIKLQRRLRQDLNKVTLLWNRNYKRSWQGIKESKRASTSI